MAKFILGKKLHMTQRFLADGTWVPVTVVEAGPCTVTQVKNKDNDGYQAVQVGFGFKRKLSKPLAGHFKGLDNYRHVREFRVDEGGVFERGKMFDLSSFQIGDYLDVAAISKGKGFQGVVRRHGFHGSPATHGHKDQLRMPGSIGAGGVQHVFKGTRMGGRMGGDRITIKNLEVIDIDLEKNLLYVKGAVPGSRNSLLMIQADGEMILKDKSDLKPEVKVEEKVVTETEAKAEEAVLEEIKAEVPEAEVVATSEEKVETPEAKVEEKVEEAKKE
jgi:large subunit ribosomal protein L3